ncbi:hypothetical protein DF185_07990 [Marinifilum breve]|uniref:Uncharacterized protein n=1 Tax=Marinifilum breve TaxID=2184082 RepID=A0A2V3ZYL0_9BACT|nr:hypothetical protein [Marinifilum breve]PXY01416.1 hypothetical protein DF185_07990 [Marinifilum breve]
MRCKTCGTYYLNVQNSDSQNVELETNLCPKCQPTPPPEDNSTVLTDYVWTQENKSRLDQMKESLSYELKCRIELVTLNIKLRLFNKLKYSSVNKFVLFDFNFFGSEFKLFFEKLRLRKIIFEDLLKKYLEINFNDILQKYIDVIQSFRKELYGNSDKKKLVKILLLDFRIKNLLSLNIKSNKTDNWKEYFKVENVFADNNRFLFRSRQFLKSRLENTFLTLNNIVLYPNFVLF